MALGNCNGDFRSDNVLDANDTYKSEASLLNIVKIISLANVVVVRATFIRFEVSVSERNCSERLAGISCNNIKESLFYIVIESSLLAVLIQIMSARLKNDFSSALHVDTSVVTVFCLAAVVNDR